VAVGKLVGVAGGATKGKLPQAVAVSAISSIPKRAIRFKSASREVRFIYYTSIAARFKIGILDQSRNPLLKESPSRLEGDSVLRGLLIDEHHGFRGTHRDTRRDFAVRA
jgi:hypothetical protein